MSLLFRINLTSIYPKLTHANFRLPFRNFFLLYTYRGKYLTIASKSEITYKLSIREIFQYIKKCNYLYKIFQLSHMQIFWINLLGIWNKGSCTLPASGGQVAGFSLDLVIFFTKLDIISI